MCFRPTGVLSEGMAEGTFEPGVRELASPIRSLRHTGAPAKFQLSFRLPDEGLALAKQFSSRYFASAAVN